MPLKDLQTEHSFPRDRAYKLSDGGGLYLFVQPNGSNLRRMNYRIAGEEKLLSCGSYPVVSIAAARRSN